MSKAWILYVTIVINVLLTFFGVPYLINLQNDLALIGVFIGAGLLATFDYIVFKEYLN